MHAYADRDSSARREFDVLYRRYARDVYRYTLAVLKNPADAEDVTQTTFMNAYRAFVRADEPIHKPQHWLIKIAHNACRTRHLRAARRPQEVPLEHHLAKLDVPADDVPDVAEVLEALAELPFNQRAALVMRELDGRTYREIAETLGMTVAAVEALIFRARRSLRLKSSAVRALGVVPLPASLTSLSGGTLAVGGALAGTGLIAKAIAVVAAGVVAGGVGYNAVEAKPGIPQIAAVEPKRGLPRKAVVARAPAAAAPTSARRRPLAARKAPEAKAPARREAVRERRRKARQRESAVLIGQAAPLQQRPASVGSASAAPASSSAPAAPKQSAPAPQPPSPPTPPVPLPVSPPSLPSEVAPPVPVPPVPAPELPNVPSTPVPVAVEPPPLPPLPKLP